MNPTRWRMKRTGGEFMPIVTFLGRVLPESARFSLRFADPINWNPFGIHMRLRAVIDQSKVTVTCELDEYKDEYLSLLYKASWDLVRAYIDLVSFSAGFGWIVFIDRYIHPDGREINLFILAKALAAECTAFKMDFQMPEESPDFMAAAKAVITETPLLYALSDLTETLTRPQIAPINFGRVLDALRKIVAPNETRPIKGWAILQKIVNVDQRYTEWVSELSIEPRHGGRIHIDGATVTEAQRRCWAVMNRFLEYRKRGNQPLPLDKFPLLRG